jgi:hypothetical protein
MTSSRSQDQTLQARPLPRALESRRAFPSNDREAPSRQTYGYTPERVLRKPPRSLPGCNCDSSSRSGILSRERMTRIVETKAPAIHRFEMVLTHANAADTTPMTNQAGFALEDIEEQVQ